MTRQASLPNPNRFEAWLLETLFLMMKSLLTPILVCWLLPLTVANAQVAVRGTLLGADGQPMQQAHLVIEDGPVDTFFVVQVGADGAFSFPLPQPGGYGLYALGVHHETLTIPLVVVDHEAVQVEIQLGAINYATELDQIRVIGDFNGFSEEEGTILMQKQESGAYAATIPVEADTLAYQILGVKKLPEPLTQERDFPLAGTQAARFVFSEEGPFWQHKSFYLSVNDVQDGQVVLLFEPEALPRPGAKPKIRSTPFTVADIATIYIDVEERELHHPGDEDRATYRRLIQAEEHPLLRHWLLLRYFDELHPVEEDSVLAHQLFEEVPSTSPLWSFEAWSSVGASNILFVAARTANQPEVGLAYAERSAEEHPDLDVQVQFLYAGFSFADRVGDEESKRRLYTRLIGEFKDTRQAEDVRRIFSAQRAIQKARPLPQFAFVSLHDSATVYTDQRLQGKTFLLDFWGTWCAPCIKEMPYLHEAYETYHDKGFEILSIAFLDDRASIEAFRKEHWPMPWGHTLVTAAEDESVRAQFELTSFPRPVLVDASGTIVAVDEEVRGEHLEEHLRRLFQDK